MDLRTLQSILTIGETIAVEFKRCGNGIESDTYETVCSFLNRFGGWPVIEPIRPIRPNRGDFHIRGWKYALRADSRVSGYDKCYFSWKTSIASDK